MARAEPLFATASLVSAWLVIEQRGAWGPDALTDSRLPTEVARELKRRSSDVRILLIRRRPATDEEPIFFKAHSGAEGIEASMMSSPLPDPTALLDVDFEALAGGDTGPGRAVEHPIYLVCTHGRHDICCADKGRPLYRAMSEARPERTWEVSHIGGDRFAGNLLVLPRGDYFGRLQPEDAEPLVSDYEMGRLDGAHYRGRSMQPRLVQAAEHFVREAENLTAMDDLEVREYRRLDHERGTVLFELSDRSIMVEVAARQDTTPALLTCRAERPGPPVAYELISMTES